MLQISPMASHASVRTFWKLSKEMIADVGAKFAIPAPAVLLTEAPPVPTAAPPAPLVAVGVLKAEEDKHEDDEFGVGVLAFAGVRIGGS